MNHSSHVWLGWKYFSYLRRKNEKKRKRINAHKLSISPLEQDIWEQRVKHFEVELKIRQLKLRYESPGNKIKSFKDMRN